MLVLYKLKINPIHRENAYLLFRPNTNHNTMPYNGIPASEIAAMHAAASHYTPPPPCDDITCVNVFRRDDEWKSYTTYALCSQCASRAPDVFKLGVTYTPPEWKGRLTKPEKIAMAKTRKSRSATYCLVFCLRERASALQASRADRSPLVSPSHDGI